MKHLILPCLSACLLLANCTNKNNIPDRTYEYEDVSHLSIQWEDLFQVNIDDYYAYIYSESCGHCREIKQDVISKALQHGFIYFIPFSSDIPIVQDSSFVIGKNDIESIGIIGTPTLFHIQDHMITEQYIGSHDILSTLTNLP